MVPRLSRVAWLAIGAIVAALALQRLPDGSAIAALGITAAAAGAILSGLGAALVGRPSLAALALGAGSVGARGGLAVSLAAGGVVAGPLPVGSGDFVGDVIDLSSPSGMEQRALVRLDGPAPSGGWLVYAWMPRHPVLLPGDRVAIRGTVSDPPADAPGFAAFLASRGAVGTVKAHAVELLRGGHGPAAIVERIRWGLDGWLAQAMPEPEAGLAAGILIGLRERVSRATAEDFTTTGLTHVVAISGWNIALVASIVTALLRATGLGRRGRSLVVIVAIVGYTVLAGAEASVIRAAVMGGVVILARESGRPSGAAAALAIACWGLLLAQPSMIGDIGLQLSLAATAGLLVLGGPGERIVGRVTRGRAPRWFSETLGVSLAAQLSTLPLILLHFGRLSLVSPLANVLVAPVVPFAMLGAAIGVLAGPVTGGPLAVPLTPLLLAAWAPLAAMTRGAEVLAVVPMASVELPPPGELAAAAVALAALVLALRRARRRGGIEGSPRDADKRPSPAARRIGRRVPAATVALILIGATTAVLVARPLPSLSIAVLDVGQGDAILLSTSDGSRLLVDGGPDPDLLARRLDERIPLWDRRLDVVVLTHPHEDHASGLAGLSPRYRVGRIVETGMASEGAGVRELRAAADRARIPRVRLAQGDTFRLGEADVAVVWPPRTAIPARAPSSGRAINDTSIVLAVRLGSQRALLTGDLEEDRDLDLLAGLPEDGRRWDLLKVAHHGSATASSAPLLAALRPRLAAVSAGEGNRYGHPARSTIDRLLAVGSRVWRTDRDGTLSFVFEGRPRSAAAMLAPAAPAPPCPSPSRTRPPHQAEGRIACYARPDAGTDPNRSTRAPARHVAVSPAAPAHDRRCRGGLVPGLSGDADRRGRRPPPGRDGGLAARCRQGPPPRPPPASARTRRRRRGLGQRGRSSRAGPRHLGPSGHAPRCR